MTPDTIREEKARLRETMRAERRQHTPEERGAASLEICARMGTLPHWLAAKTILFYAPLPDEPDVRWLLHHLDATRQRAAFLRDVPETEAYEAHLIQHMEELRPGAFGVAEPIPEAPGIALKQLDFILVPGVAFDPSGRRLGRGRGFYDRLLAGLPGHTCGVAFPWQLVSEVPMEAHDVMLNSILTPTHWHQPIH